MSSDSRPTHLALMLPIAHDCGLATELTRGCLSSDVSAYNQINLNRKDTCNSGEIFILVRH